MSPSNEERLSGSYALLTVHDRNNRLEVIQAVTGIEQVISASAVDGDFDLVLQIRELPGAGIDKFVSNKIKTLKGVKSVEVCRVELDCGVEQLPRSLEDSDKAKSANLLAECFLFLETDKRNFEDIFSRLSVLQSVSSCEVASGEFSLVLRLAADNFDLLDKVIKEKILPLPGVLRAKESRILKLTGF
jgi:DNA-binding Lrp family transcriptional regulator